MTTDPDTPNRDLAGRVALITGAGSGIGAATARLLGVRGAAVAVNYRGSAERAEKLVADLAESGTDAVAVKADVTDPDAVAELVARTERELGPIDILVLNAVGISGREVRPGPFLGTEWETVERVVLAQGKAFFHAARAVAPGMVERGRGAIVAVGAAMSRRPSEGFLPLVMAKSAVEGAIRTMAKELGTSGVRVNGVAPGLTLSDIGMAMPEQARQASAKRSALGRNGTPEDIANLIGFLVSDQAAYLTGSYLVADGGTSML